MPSNVYEFIGTKNARLAKFLDDHPNVSEVMMKLVIHLENMARERGRMTKDDEYSVHASPNGKLFVVKIR